MRQALKDQLEEIRKEQEGPERVPSYPCSALSMGRDQFGKWTLVTIPYNMDTGEVGPIERTVKDDRGICEEQFKIDVVNKIFLKEEV
jgi:hypothetical protein